MHYTTLYNTSIKPFNSWILCNHIIGCKWHSSNVLSLLDTTRALQTALLSFTLLSITNSFAICHFIVNQKHERMLFHLDVDCVPAEREKAKDTACQSEGLHGRKSWMFVLFVFFLNAGFLCMLYIVPGLSEISHWHFGSNKREVADSRMCFIFIRKIAYFIVIQWSTTASLNHNKIWRIPYENSLPTGVRNHHNILLRLTPQ